MRSDEIKLVDSMSKDDICPKACGSSLICDPRRNVHKYFVLIFICLLSFGNYFCYDNPAALQDKFLRDMDMSPWQYTLLYSVYSWPNVVLSFAGGFLIDRVFGIRLGAIIFSFLILLGQLVLGVGALANNIITTYVARFIFGMGGESLAVAQNVYAASWFKESELNFVFGLLLSMSRIGSTVNMNSMARIYNALSHKFSGYTCLGWTLLVGGTTAVFSFIVSLILGFFDRRQKKILRKSDTHLGEKIQFLDVLRFPASFWFICMICVTYYGAVFPFVSVALVFFKRKYVMTTNSANLANSMVYLISAIASPITGILIDYTGKNLLWVMFGISLTLLCHVSFTFTFFVPPFATVVCFGISYSILASALWPLVSIVMPPHQRATAYGLMQAIQNLGLGIVNTLTGIIIDRYGYFVLGAFFLLCECIAVLFGALLYFYDATNGGSLNLSGKRRREKIIEEIDHVSISYEESVRT